MCCGQQVQWGWDMTALHGVGQDKLLCKRQAACARGKTGLLVCVVCCFSVENVNVGHGLHGQVGLCLHMGGEVLDGLCCWSMLTKLGRWHWHGPSPPHVGALTKAQC